MNFKIFSRLLTQNGLEELEKEVNDFLDEYLADVISMNTTIKKDRLIICLIYKVRV